MAVRDWGTGLDVLLGVCDASVVDWGEPGLAGSADRVVRVWSGDAECFEWR